MKRKDKFIIAKIFSTISVILLVLALLYSLFIPNEIYNEDVMKNLLVFGGISFNLIFIISMFYQ